MNERVSYRNKVTIDMTNHKSAAESDRLFALQLHSECLRCGKLRCVELRDPCISLETGFERNVKSYALAKV